MTDSDIDVVRAYHERTKHRLDGYARGPEYLDWENQPNPFRQYQGCERIQLPLAQYNETSADASDHLDLNKVAALLELSLGLSAWKQYGPDRWSLRCNPSSGNLHPTEGYVIAQGIAGLDAGVYHYSVYPHALEKRASISDPINKPPLLLLGLSSIVWREAWKYGERAYRYVQLDVGHAIAAIKYAASTLGLKVSILTLSDATVAQLLGIDREQDYSNADREQPDVLLRISKLDDSNQSIKLPEPKHWTGSANTLGGEPRHHWKVLDQIHQATINTQDTKPSISSLDTTAPDTQSLDSPEVQQTLLSSAHTLTSLIRQRRSGQAFNGKTSAISREAFFNLLHALLPTRDKNAPQYWDLPTYVHLLFFIHRVDGLQPGLYAFPRSSQAKDSMQHLMHDSFNWSKPEHCPQSLPLYELQTGDLRRQARAISCHQEIASSSSFSLGMLGEFDHALQQGAHSYRKLFWEAAFLGHHLYLQAEAIGKRGTGIGCFFDDEFHQLLGLEDSYFQDLYHFTVGDPINDERLQTLPPYAHLNSIDSEQTVADQQRMQTLKQNIAQIFQQREALKLQLENGQVKASSGFSQLARLDNELSELDSAFKSLWDKYNQP